MKKEEEEEEKKPCYEEISYPATPMLSIAELEFLNRTELYKNSYRFKTAAERKQLPELSYFTNDCNFLSKNYTKEYHLS